MRWRMLIGGLVALPLLVGAQTLYVKDELRVGVREAPNSRDAPIAVVTTGTRLEVLERTEGYTRVRTPEGEEGWVSDAYVDAEAPAAVQLEDLRSEHAALQRELSERTAGLERELADVRAAAAATVEENDRLSGRLEALQAANADLTRQLERLRPPPAAAGPDRTWLRYLAGGVVIALCGFLLGVRWQRRRVTERLGGFEIG